MIGLKGCMKPFKGMIWYRWLHELWWQIRYAWQRAWRGYDSRDLFELDNQFLNRMKAILSQFKENNACLFVDPDTQKTLSEEETDQILNQMLYYLINSDENVWITQGLDFKKDYDTIKNIEKIAYSNRQAFLAMFVKYFDQLWY